MNDYTNRVKNNFPVELQNVTQWVVWRSEPDPNRDKPRKTPYNPITGIAAKSNDSNTWATFDIAANAHYNGGYTGLGFMFSANDLYVGIDLDDCVTDGVIEPWAMEIIESLNTYTEYSPSGTGIHLILQGVLPDGGRRKGQIEMYETGRYFTVTGEHVDNTPKTVEQRRTALEALHDKTFAKPQKQPVQTHKQPTAPTNLNDQELLNKMFSASNGVQVRDLWNGDTGGDHSAADLTLCSRLVHWTNKDAMRVDALFRQSGLMRDKWDKVHFSDGTTYGQRTIETAIANYTDTQKLGPSIDNIVSQLKSIAQQPKNERQSAVTGLGDEIASLPKKHDLTIVETLTDYVGLNKGDARKFVDDCRADAKTDAKPTSPDLDPSLPIIITNNRQLRDKVSDTHGCILQLNTEGQPKVFVKGGVLCRVAIDEEGIARAQNLEGDTLSEIVSHAANWVTQNWSDGKLNISQVDPPKRTLASYLAKGEWPNIPALAGVVSAPTFSDTGTLHSEYGYNPDTRLFYSDNLELESMSIEEAKALILDDLLCDFPFENEASKAHAVALLLLPFIRPMISGPTPLHLIDAPTPGSGKGLLASICSIPYMGYEPSSTAAGNDDDEWRKRLTSALLLGSSHISIDNITGPLESGVLASYLTQEFVEDRILGTSTTVRLKIRNTWIANGNNVLPSDEIARRCIWIRLDANAEKPWDRTGFKHNNLKTWTLENRTKIVLAIITIVQHWIDEGMPSYKGKLKGSYEKWTQIIGGILQSAGINGFMGNSDELYETAVTENDLWAEFVKEWADRYGQVETFASDLFKLASHSDDCVNAHEYKDLLGDLLGSGKERSRSIKMGKLLGNMRGKVIAGYKIEKATSSGGKKRWQLRKIYSGDSGDSGDSSIPHSNMSDKKNNIISNPSSLLGGKHSPLSPLSPQNEAKTPDLVQSNGNGLKKSTDFDSKSQFPTCLHKHLLTSCVTEERAMVTQLAFEHGIELVWDHNTKSNTYFIMLKGMNNV